MSPRPAGIDLALLYRLAPAFVGGVGATLYGCGTALLVGSAGLLVAALIGARRNPERYGPYLPFALLAVTVALIGGLRAGLLEPLPAEPASVKFLDGRWVRALATPRGHPKAGENGVRVTAELTEIRVRHGDAWRSMDGPPLSTIVSVKGEKNAWIYSKGAVLEVSGYLRRPSHNANPGVHSYRDYLRQQQLFALLYVDSPRRARVKRWPDGPEAALGKAAGRFGRWVNERVGERGALIRALAVGDRSGVSAELTEMLRSSGTSHVLAISGLHMAVAGTFFFFIARFLLLRWSWLTLRVSVRKIAIVAALAGVVGYAILTGASESTQRAAVMFAAAAGALVLERRFSALRAIALAATVLLSIEPKAFAGISFQLSFSAAFAIIVAFRLLAPRWGAEPAPETSRRRRMLRRIGRGMRAILISSVAANLATGPLAAYYFGCLSLNGIAANLLVLPIVELVLLPASLLSFTVWLVSPEAAGVVLAAASHSARWVECIVTFVATHLPLELGLAFPGAFELMLYFGGFASVALGIYFRKRPLWAGGAATLALLLLTVFSGAPSPGDLEVQVLDVGRGRVTVARWSDGRSALIDLTRAGSFPYAERTVLPALRAQRLSSIDLLVFGGSEAGADAALSHYEETLEPSQVWKVGDETLAARCWPEGESPRLAFLPKGQAGPSKGWALVIEGNHGRYVMDGAPGYWPQSWPRLWERGHTAVEFSAGALGLQSNRWLLARLRPDLVLLPQGSRHRDRAALSLTRQIGRGWTRVRFDAEGLRVEHLE